MKKKGNKDIIILVIILPIFMLVAFYISDKTRNNTMQYSVSNKYEMGYSLFYDALKELNYPVEKTTQSLTSLKSNSVQVISPGGKFNVNNEKVQKWVSDGGVLIYLTAGKNINIEYGVEETAKDDIKVYTYHKGKIINANADALLNKTLIKDSSKSYEILKVIAEFQNGKLYFNETHLFSTEKAKSLWESTPIEIKYVIYQIFIVMCAFLYYKGKRFGKKLIFYEEVERTENEYLYSAASLYSRAKCLDIMLDNYYKNFLKEFKNNEEHWIEYWEREEIPSFDKAKKVYEFISSKKLKVKPKQYIQIITIIEYLNKVLEKRRGINWKELKKDSQKNLQQE